MKFSIVTPTFNSMRTIQQYMDAVIAQDYSHGETEIIFADGGSTDGTLDRFKEFQEKLDIPVTVCGNPLRTAETGKTVAVRKTSGEVICLLDSDNIIPAPVL